MEGFQTISVTLATVDDHMPPTNGNVHGHHPPFTGTALLFMQYPAQEIQQSLETNYITLQTLIPLLSAAIERNTMVLGPHLQPIALLLTIPFGPMSVWGLMGIETMRIPDFTNAFQNPLNGHQILDTNSCVYAIAVEHPLSWQLIAVWQPFSGFNPSYHFIVIVAIPSGFWNHLIIILESSGVSALQQPIANTNLALGDSSADSAGTLTESAALAEVFAVYHISSSMIRAATYQQQGLTLPEMINSLRSVSWILAIFGLPSYQDDAAAESTTSLTGGHILTSIEILAHLGWVQLTYKRKAYSYIWAERAALKTWNTGNTNDHTCNLYQKWRGVIWLFCNSQSYNASVPIPCRNAVDIDEQWAFHLSENDISSPKNSMIDQFLV
ncbi:hypothetical protein FA15DRAFT_660476 [Coprinopsis marcescibilis]|uniref:Uncharacterized protein n=1 Tax=Coprinopsis marcescibilis TaxID=230819 RepID=A0A5C3KFR7_COPMA|nr:hypothetical protein FA15DRAFT_660476 [Coprinopsis marcescibilis]